MPQKRKNTKEGKRCEKKTLQKRILVIFIKFYSISLVTFVSGLMNVH